MISKNYEYKLELQWKGDSKLNSTKNDRIYEVKIEGKPSFMGSADQVFHGNPELYNPEDLLLSALSACHMMSYLYVCRKAGIRVLSYSDNAFGTLKVNQDGSGRFESVTLKPIITIENKDFLNEAIKLHKEAGKLCFIANSVNFEIKYDIKID
jgi:organic hydroperoxide reductase OsmC/OhrA